MPESKLRIPLIVLVSIVVLGIVWFFAVMISRAGKTPIDVIVSPKDSKVTLDGKGIGTGTVYISSGKHTIKATREHFADVSKEIDSANLKDDNKVYLILETTDAEGDAYVQAHEDEGAIRGRIGGQEYSETADRIYQKYPFVAQLPVDNIDYRIDYTVDAQKNVSFQVTLQPSGTKPGSSLYIEQLQTYKAEALEWLQKQGLDTAKADITFTPDPDNQTP